MSAGNVDLFIDQGEDWAVQVLWTDPYGDPISITPPMRMEIRDLYNVAVVALEAPDTPDPASPMLYNADTGLIQLQLTSDQTSAMSPGTYSYDLFVATPIDDPTNPKRIQRLIEGNVFVSGRVTKNV